MVRFFFLSKFFHLLICIFCLLVATYLASDWALTSLSFSTVLKTLSQISRSGRSLGPESLRAARAVAMMIGAFFFVFPGNFFYFFFSEEKKKSEQVKGGNGSGGIFSNKILNNYKSITFTVTQPFLMTTKYRIDSVIDQSSPPMRNK